MIAPRHDIAGYAFDPAQTYFLDANVWFLVYGPSPPSSVRMNVYSDAVKRLRASGAPALIDALVMSEFANAYARFAFKRAGGGDFKTFRRSVAFRQVAEDIAISLRGMLAFAKPSSTAFANINLIGVIATFEKGGSDFNDLLIVETCQSKSCVLVTDDGDMKTSDVPIVTANRSLLSP